MRALLICAALSGAGSPAIAGPPDLSDPHLNIVPRSAEEAARVAAVTAPTRTFDAAERFESNPGGAATVRARSDADAFSLPSANLDFEAELDFRVGNGLFRKLWVSSPASTLASDGLGPLYNARSCQRCHLKDGRGHPPEGPQDNRVSMFLRLSVPSDQSGMSEIETYLAGLGGATTRPEPTYGSQLQDVAVLGHAAEGRMEITYEEIEVALSGGETASLRKPTYSVSDPAYGPLHPDTMLSPRVASPMIGLGLIEAIPTADLLSAVDPEDADGDGISGRAQVTWSLAHDAPMLGRFGWKAGNPTVLDQSASAFAGDIGISTPLHPLPSGDCTAAQAACMDGPHGDGDDRVFEIGQEGLDFVAFYSRNLAVPARRDVDDPQVLRGKQVFHDSGCIACHRPKYVTHRLADRDAQSFQLIWPYSDFLLHDMGPGLADNRPEGLATGSEWKTPPLWGIGLTEQVNGHTYFLHDGRARSLLEAVLWHGGEAEAAKTRVVEMEPEDRAALIRFLESL
ncbi:di-heme oxidoreductase family protein [Pseudoponticoccus marisrubri]|uniref:Thiol oxidoreductase n=1 Tax=Pseudoponticoccus marisrubri TaxID=1685382 RepID=A0A0W7WQH2_9RHOB|nr:di-heme oxidoredictase family protein [Pseudoponticoccus marisrubri]KUF12805.1 thiol oxidoreductase [Pseudoponticoccus marisrubri]